MAVEESQLVTCGGCGVAFELMPRNVRAARARGEDPLCHFCRHPPKPPDAAAIERMKRWWLKRYSMEELLELGREIGWL